MWQSLKILKVFNGLTMEYCFLVESTKIEKASVPYKTVISEANVKTNKMVTPKWTYHKGQSFVTQKN